MPDADSEPTFALVRCQSHPMFSGFLFRLLTQIALYLFVAVYKPGMGKRICLIQTDQVDSMVERPNSYRKGANIPAPRRRHIHVIPVLLRSLRLEHRPRLEMETRLYFLESMNSSFKSLPSCVMTEFSGCELTEIKTLIRSSCPTATVLSSKSKAIITPINQPPLCIDESRHYATGTGRVSRSEPIV